MPVFEYAALDKENRPVSGREIAPDQATADLRLRARGLHIERLSLAVDPGDPLSASTAGKAADPGDNRSQWHDEVIGPLFGRIPAPDLFHFFRQTSALLDAGIGPSHALATLGGQISHARLAEIAKEASQATLTGATMSTVFERYPYVFGSIALSMLRVGEANGRLEIACAMIADYYERDHEIRQMIRRDTLYPKLVLGASIVIIFVANAIILSLGSSNTLSSPLTSLDVWLVLGPLLIGAFVLWRVGMAKREVRARIQEILSRVPGVGKPLQGYAMARFGAALGSLHHGGVPLPRALEAACEVSGLEKLRALAGTLVRALEHGDSLAEAMARSGAFPDVVLTMVRTGEQSGSLDAMLTKVSQYLLDEAHTSAKQGATTFGVLVLLGVGVYMGLVIIRFYTGYFAGLLGGG